MGPQHDGHTGGVDLYVGGVEHAVLHLLYSRFWHKVLFDAGWVKHREPFAKLVHQGVILGENNEKMSKARGNVVNPDGIKNQIEGGVIQSASWTLREHVQFDRNGILSQDWSNYAILTMPDVPKVETVLIDRPNERALGAGEAAQGPTAAAIANAFAAATGRRIRELPLTPERVKAALV